MGKVELVGGQISQMIRQKYWSKGVKLPSTAELAKRFGVSYVTACRALVRLQDEGWVRRQNGVGTFVVRDALSAPETKKIGVPLRVEGNPFFISCYEELSRVCTQTGMEIILGNGAHEADFIEQLATRGERAMIRFPTDPRHEYLLQQKLKECCMRAVTLNDWWFDGGFFPCVCTDEGTAIATLLDHLFKNGHRQIALLDDARSCKRLHAHAAFTKWHWRHQSDPGPEQFLYFWDKDFHDRLIGLASNRVTALVSLFDVLTIKTLERLAAAGIGVPAQLSIVSMDGTRQILERSVTTMRQNVGLLISKAVEILLLPQEEKPDVVKVEADFHPGNTVAKLDYG